MSKLGLLGLGLGGFRFEGLGLRAYGVGFFSFDKSTEGQNLELVELLFVLGAKVNRGEYLGEYRDYSIIPQKGFNRDDTYNTPKRV